MRVTVDVKGGDAATVDLETLERADGAERPTHADLLDAVDLSRHEATVLVDGRPVPADEPVETDHVTVLRLIAGG